MFRPATRHVVASGRFLTVTAVALTLNTVLLWTGAAMLSAPFVAVQGVALVAIPIVNHVTSSRWTFRVT